MSKLVNRTQITTTFRNDLNEAVNELSKKTKVPKSKLLDIALELLLKWHEERIENAKYL